MPSVLDQLMQSPKLGKYSSVIADRLRVEQARRERFYDEMTEQQKVEFINGEVVLHSPVKIEHSDCSENYFMLLKTYVRRKNLGRVGHEKLLISLTRNDYEPDVVFWRTEKASLFRPRQMRFPAPDLIAEVLSESTEANDRGVKFEDYADHGVGEYLLIDPVHQLVEQYLLDGETYRLHIKSDSGILRSAVVEGFDIPIPAIFNDVDNTAALRAMLSAT